jgi:predicted DNA binding CopG/RHH family protein
MEKKELKFNSPGEEAIFWETHDPLDFVDETEEVRFVPTPELAEKHRLKSMTIRLDESQIADAKALAGSLKVPYQTYLRGLISQALAAEKRRLFVSEAGAEYKAGKKKK